MTKLSRYGVMLITFIAGALVSNISTVLDLSGSIFATAMVYIIVPWLYIKIKG